jgi:hypothetical protein
MTLSSSHYLTVNVSHVHLLPEYRPQLDVSLSPEGDPKFLARRILSEKMQQFDFGEFTHHILETSTPTISSGPSGRNPVDLNEVDV